jgi:hypothetical protein
MKTFLIGLLRFAIGLALLFVAAGLVWTLSVVPLGGVDRENVAWPALIGFGGGVLFFTLVSRVLVLYVFGHELTHWFAAKLFLRETGDVEVGSSGGSVAVQKPNIWITLAPYFIPFYTLVWIGIFGIFHFAYGSPPPPLALKVVYAGIGLTYAFHVTLTAYSLLREQADLRAHGQFMSLALILCTNVLLLTAGLLTVSHRWNEGSQVFVRRLGLEWQGLATATAWTTEQATALAHWVGGFF